MKKALIGVLVGLPVLFVGGFAAMAGGTLGQAAPDGPPSAAALSEIPPADLALYQQAGHSCPGVTWNLLAAQGKQESNFDPAARSPVGAEGIAQFMPGTWASWGGDGNGDGRSDPFDPADAIPAQARYDCALLGSVLGIPGAPSSLMLAAYNAGLGAVARYGGIPPYAETQRYVTAVIATAATYAGAASQPVSADASALLANPKLTLSGPARADLEAGLIDQRLITALGWLLERHTLHIGGFKTGHPMTVVGQGNTTAISNHYYGRAADIGAVDGVEVSPTSTAARQVVDELTTLTGQLVPGEVGSPLDLPNPGFFTNPSHQGHIHLGYFSATTGQRGP